LSVDSVLGLVRALWFMNVFYESLSIRESMVLKDKDVIREVNGFYLTLIMNYLWRIDLYAMTISNGHFTV
jgi:hypothetical protein